MSEGSAGRLVTLDLDEYVRLDAFGPFGNETDWHVNRRLDVGDPNGADSMGYVLQRADGREQWLVLAFRDDGDGWDLSDAAIRGGAGNQVPVTETPTPLAFASVKEALS